MKKNIIIHIGLPKTGTTYLQERVFSFIKNICYKTKEEQYSKLNDFFSINFLNFKEDELYHLKTEILQGIEKIGHTKILLSSEDFTNYLCFYSFLDRDEKIFSFINKVFPDARIFLVVRKQDDWINSMFNQVVKHKASTYLNFNNFIGYSNRKFIENKEGFLNIYDFDWHRLIKLLENKFGKDNIFVLPYELFNQNPDDFLTKFYENYGLEPFYPLKTEKKVNQKGEIYPLYCYKLYCHIREDIIPEKIKIFLRKNDKSLLKWLETLELNIKIPKLSKKQAAQVMKIHRESNKKLAEYIGMDLSQYGYY